MSDREPDQDVQLGALTTSHLGQVIKLTFGDTGIVQGRLLAVHHNPGQRGPRTELQVEWWDRHVFTFDHDSDTPAVIVGRAAPVAEPFRDPNMPS